MFVGASRPTARCVCMQGAAAWLASLCMFGLTPDFALSAASRPSAHYRQLASHVCSCSSARLGRGVHRRSGILAPERSWSASLRPRSQVARTLMVLASCACVSWSAALRPRSQVARKLMVLASCACASWSAALRPNSPERSWSSAVQLGSQGSAAWRPSVHWQANLRPHHGRLLCARARPSVNGRQLCSLGRKFRQLSARGVMLPECSLSAAY